MIQISFRTQDSNIRDSHTIRNPLQNSQLIHNPVSVFKIRESARFTTKIHNPWAFKAKSVDPKTSSPQNFSLDQISLEKHILIKKWRRNQLFMLIANFISCNSLFGKRSFLYLLILKGLLQCVIVSKEILRLVCFRVT